MSIKQSSIKIYKKNFRLYNPNSLIFGLIAIIVLILGYIFPITYLISVPFLLLPFLLSYQMSCIFINDGVNVNLNFFFSSFKVYFRNNVFGVFSVLKSFLYSLLIFLISYVLCSVIFINIFANNDPTLMNLLRNISVTQDINALLESLANNESFINASNLSIATSLFPGICFFIHSILIHSIKIYMVDTFLDKRANMRSISIFYNISFKNIRGKFLKEYYSCIWFIILGFVIGYFSGVVISYFLINNSDGYQMATIGLFIALLINLIFFPYIFTFINQLYCKYKNDLKYTVAANLCDDIQKELESDKLSEEQKKVLNEILSSLKQYNKPNTDDKSEKNDNSKDN